MTDEGRAIKLHGEVFGYLYRGAQTVLEDKRVSVSVLYDWCKRMDGLCYRSMQLHKAVRTEQSKRAYTRALELKIKLKDKLKIQYGEYI